MSLRKLVAVGVLAVWALALGWHAKRLYLQPESERLALAARTLPPGVAYYALYRGDRQVGWAQSEIDTLPSASGFTIRDRLEMDLSLGEAGGRLQVRSRARLGPALELRRFSVEAGGLVGDVAAEGEMQGDSLLELRIRRPGGQEDRHSIPVEGSVVLGTSLPLRLAAEGDLRPGDRFRVPTFDPLQMRLVERTVEVLEREVRSFPDSVVREEGTDGWRIARRDTVVAWRIGRETGGMEIEAWIDEDGRFLELEVQGVRLERTAFELAYYGWRGREAADAPPPAESSPRAGGNP